MVNEPAGPTTDLQFDKAEPKAGSSAASALSCGYCARPIGAEYFSVSGRTTCAQCRATVATLMEPRRGTGPFMLALLFGLGAGIAGAIIYYAVIAITNFEIGIVAILIGYMVGYAVRKGAGGRGGRRFQVLAVTLTYIAVGLAYTPIAMKGALETKTAASSEAAPAGAAQLVKTGASPIAVARSIGMLAVLAVALPVLVVAGSMPTGLLSAAIIFFGMQQAWRMTGLPRLVVSGPYRVGDRAAANP